MNDKPQSMSKKKVEKLVQLAELLDSKFSIPGTNIRFGFDAIIGLIPGIGDTATLLLSCYIIYQARSFKIPSSLMLKMIANVIIDWSIGSIPIMGDVFDLVWKANQKNIALLTRYLEGYR